GATAPSGRGAGRRTRRAAPLRTYEPIPSAAMKRVEFFYDYSSPWTYLAFTRIEELCRRHDAELIWRPILVGGIFNTVNPSVYQSRERPVPAKARYMFKDLHDWARLYGITIKFPPSVFPVNSVKA